MCSFGSCQTRFEFLSQFRKVRNAFECFVTQVQTHLPKTKRVWPMKINVICTVAMSRLPPCEPVFLQHVLRTMWQVKLWVNARTTELIAGSPFEYGWTTTDDGIELLKEYMTASEMK